MTDDRGILIKNIYYMLAYAFKALRQTTFENVASEKFDSVQDLFAAILARGIAKQLKQGLHRVYESRHETIATLRGKLDITETIRNRIQNRRKLACEFDELIEDNIYNQILKTTIHYLMQDRSVKPERRKELKHVALYFADVTLLEPRHIRWDVPLYHRNNQNYEMLINICFFVLKGMLQTTQTGEYRLASFSDEHMAKLYERFVLEYYRRHHSYLHVAASQVKWYLIGHDGDPRVRLLPLMQTDITLRLGERTLIIDTKYYGSTMQTQYDKRTLHSANIYQIFSYVKNCDTDGSGDVAGVLLYAKTQEEITPDCMFNMGGNMIGARTLDLNKDFKLIAWQLDEIAAWYFGDHAAIERAQQILF